MKSTKIFSGISEKELPAMLKCLEARKCTFEKGEYIFRVGELIGEVALFLGAGHLLVYVSKGLVSCETLFSE